MYGLFASLFVGNILMLIIGLLGVRLFCRVVELPKRFIIPVIITLSMVGAYSMNNSIFDMWVCVAFGVIGYIMQKADMPSSPIILAVILGPMAESNLRRAVLMYEGSLLFPLDQADRRGVPGPCGIVPVFILPAGPFLVEAPGEKKRRTDHEGRFCREAPQS